jgi:Protein kinase domain
MACKSFTSSHMQQYEAKVKVLRLLERQQNPRLIKLLATYHWHDTYCILFPWAESNLQELWAYPSRWDDTSEVKIWALEQMLGLVIGLDGIHRGTTYSDTQVVQGRHGDLHPKNILVLKVLDELPEAPLFGTLQIGDMGHTEFFASTSTFSVPTNTGIYEGPECELGLPASPIYDIWSLGCIFLDFITWVLSGPAGRTQFALERQATTIIMGIESTDDYFFDIAYSGKDAIGARLRPSVETWVTHLQQHESCQGALRSCLNLIQSSMLRIEPEVRLPTRELLPMFHSIVAQARSEKRALI